MGAPLDTSIAFNAGDEHEMREKQTIYSNDPFSMMLELEQDLDESTYAAFLYITIVKGIRTYLLIYIDLKHRCKPIFHLALTASIKTTHGIRQTILKCDVYVDSTDAFGFARLSC